MTPGQGPFLRSTRLQATRSRVAGERRQEGEMAFGMSKPATRRRDLSDLPDDMVGWS